MRSSAYDSFIPPKVNISMYIKCIRFRHSVSTPDVGKTSTLLRGTDRVTTLLPLEIIFPPGNFDRDETAVRQNITARVTTCVDTFFTELDDWAIPYITAHSERLVGKQLTEDEVRFAYTSCIKRPEDKDPMLKLKTEHAHEQESLQVLEPRG